MVDYCENITDCRRSQQLKYFAEHYSMEQCINDGNTACDNCSNKDTYKTIDATKAAIQIAKCVQDLCSGKGRFTLLHIVDVLKGSQRNKVVAQNHQETAYHAQLKEWNRSDIQRLMHRMIIDGYLKEELISMNGRAHFYLIKGVKINM